MKKTKVLTRTLLKLVLVFALLLTILASNYNASAANTNENSAQESDDLIPVSSRRRKKTGKQYEIDLLYPRYKNVALNKEIVKKIDALEKSFWQNIGPQETRSEEYFDKFSDPHSLLGNYKYSKANNRYASVLFTSGLWTGGAHPIPLASTLCFDTKINKALDLNDIFIKNSKYLDRLSIKSRIILQTKHADALANSNFWEDGTSPKPENFRYFGLSDKGLWIYFAPYSVAAYAYGGITCAIPYSELSDILAIDIS